MLPGGDAAVELTGLEDAPHRGDELANRQQRPVGQPRAAGVAKGKQGDQGAAEHQAQPGQEQLGRAGALADLQMVAPRKRQRPD